MLGLRKCSGSGKKDMSGNDGPDSGQAELYRKCFWWLDKSHHSSGTHEEVFCLPEGVIFLASGGRDIRLSGDIYMWCLPAHHSHASLQDPVVPIHKSAQGLWPLSSPTGFPFPRFPSILCIMARFSPAVTIFTILSCSSLQVLIP